MTRTATTCVIIASLALAAGAGCGGSGDGTSTATAPAKAQRAKRPRERPPASLGRIESGAEDTIDYAHAGDRAKVVATARKVKRAAAGRVIADLRSAGVAPDAIAVLQARARLLSAIAPRAGLARVSLAANQLSALMPELFARFRDPVPPGVLQLDYLDREAQLRSIAGDRASVRPAVRRLATTWAALRPRVLAAGGRGVARRFSAHVRAMRRLARGSSAQALEGEAAAGLELVDELERQFRKRRAAPTGRNRQ